MPLQSEEYMLRPLEAHDFHKGYIELLAQLTAVGDVSETHFLGQLEPVQKQKQVLVVEDVRRRKVAATGSLLIQKKHFRNFGKAGHIEDIVVDRDVRGLDLGQRVVEALTTRAEEAGCYKGILDCTEENVSFYETCGFLRNGVQMARALDTPSHITGRLSEEYNLRPLEVGDFHKGYFELLAQFTVVGDVSETQFVGELEELQKEVLVVEDFRRSKVVATGSLLIGKKFVGKAGHLEDIVVDKDVRGQHLGQRMVEALTTRAEEAGCYEAILNCTVENASFYAKCGFFISGVQMARYF